MSNSIDYASAGVNVEAGYEAVNLMRNHVTKTFTKGVLSGIGGFGGLFELGNQDMKNPVLVSGTDGVGTKLKIAFILDKHDTIGQDCVAMCVNDIACAGAKPLFFLDYIATGKNKPDKIAKIVEGVAAGCMISGCALIGGETAEMPGFYAADEYDLAGFAVGIVDKDKIIDKSGVKKGDAIIGLASSGIHSNGYSLVRKMFNLNGNDDDKKLCNYIDSLGCTLGEELLRPTKIYVPLLNELSEKFGWQGNECDVDSSAIHGIAHITGGGFFENIPRMLPDGLRVVIKKDSFDILPVFKFMLDMVPTLKQTCFNTFNMGIGMVLAVDNSKADEILRFIDSQNQKAYIIGEVVEGEHGVDLT